jgi:hypothetical protein
MSTKWLTLVKPYSDLCAFDVMPHLEHPKEKPDIIEFVLPLKCC